MKSVIVGNNVTYELTEQDREKLALAIEIIRSMSPRVSARILYSFPPIVDVYVPDGCHVRDYCGCCFVAAD